MSEPLIRLSRPTDINNLTTLDLKCYPYPLKLEEWQKLVNQSGQRDVPRIVMIEVMRQAVGFAMWNYDWEKKVTNLIRLAILKQYRMKGLAKILMRKCEMESCKSGMGSIRTIISDIHCCPGDPDDVSDFLMKIGFHTTGEIVRDFRKMYGNMVDGYVFERKVAV